jgi:hypothetical protein
MVRLSALRAGRLLPPGRFLVLISVRGHSAAGRIRSIEKIHLIRTRTRDLPACSIVLQPTTLPRAAQFSVFVLKNKSRLFGGYLKLKILNNYRYTRVEAGSNTSTVILRVVGGDEKGSLKCETVKYGLKSQGTRTRERLRW